jgi:hypothetical protein
MIDREFAFQFEQILLLLRRGWGGGGFRRRVGGERGGGGGEARLPFFRVVQVGEVEEESGVIFRLV